MERLVPCRKCDNCLKRRAQHWSLRAKMESAAASRTWMGTITLNPESVARGLNICRSAMRKQGFDYDALPPGDKFAQLDRLMFGEFQKRVKLLRKNVAVPFRYLAVTEAHESGLPHWHVLLHESDPDRRFRYDEDLNGRMRVRCVGTDKRKWLRFKRGPFWLLGFQDFDLCDPEKPWEAAYVCKYLSKDVLARVRASIGYGKVSDLPTPPQAEVKAVKRSVAETWNDRPQNKGGTPV